jgi:hypothetical protein
MSKIITKLGPFELNKMLPENSNLEEFSEEEYSDFASAGAPRTLKDEKIYSGPDIEFNGANWISTIATNHGLIFNISLQVLYEGNVNDYYYDWTLKYLINSCGKYDEHPFLKKLYVWKDSSGNMSLGLVKKMGFSAINLIVTSDSIAEEMTNYVNNISTGNNKGKK